MESSQLLQDAERERAELAVGLVVPPWYDGTIGITLAMLLIANAIDVASDAVGAKVLFLAALILFGGNAMVQVRRFRQRNGAWVSGWRRGATVPASIAGGLVYLGGLFGAAAAGDAGLWWLVVLIAGAAGVAYVAGSRWWMRLYRAEFGPSAA